MTDSLLAAERAVLGSMMLDPEAFARATRLLRADYFSDQFHRQAYAAALRASEAGPVDLLTVRSEMELDGKCDAARLSALVDDIPDIGNVKTYCGLIVESAHRRAIATFLEHAPKLLDSRMTSAEIARTIGDSAYGILDTAPGAERQEFVDMRAAVGSLNRKIDAVASQEFPWVPSGFDKLDGMILGFEPGDVSVICGETSHGKTAFALAMALRMARAGRRVAFVSLEMPLDQVTGRLAGQIASLAYQDVLFAGARGAESPQMAAYTKASMELEGLSIFPLDASRVSVPQITSHLRALARKATAEVLFVDYLQLVDGVSRDLRAKTVEVSRGLKQLSKDFRVPVIALAQLRRKDRKSENCYVTLDEIKESSQIEQDASIVMGVHWHHRCTGNPSDWPIFEMDILKQRNGPCGRVAFGANWNFQQFYDVEGYAPSREPVVAGAPASGESHQIPLDSGDEF